MPQTTHRQSTRATAIFLQVDRYASLISTFVALLLAAIYFLWAQPPEAEKEARSLWSLGTSLIANSIPILLVFSGAHFLYGKINQLRTEEAKDQAARAAAEQTKIELEGSFGAIESQVRLTTRLVRDYEETGVERVSSSTEIPIQWLNEIQNTRSLRVLGIGNGWLIDGKHHDRLRELLSRADSTVTILMPDPLCPLIKERYTIDEPLNKKLSPTDLRDRILFWVGLRAEFPRLQLRAYHRYPMVTMSIFDGRAFVSSVLFQSRASESLTFSFKKVSAGFELYEKHFAGICDSGAYAIDDEYVSKLKAATFPTTWNAA